MPRRVNKQELKIGQTFGSLTVISLDEGYHYEPAGHKRHLIKVKCQCGIEYVLAELYLKRKGGSRRCKNCRGQNLRVCKVGEKYGKLTVREYTTNSNGRPIVICDCDCGGSTMIRADTLTSRNNNNCGCEHRASWKGYGEISSTFLYRIKRNAEVRNIKFDLTIEYLWELFLTQDRKCSLSGLDIGFNFRTDGKNTASLDRKDSSKPYVIENVQWVHKDINKMKMEFGEEKFLFLCKLITEHKQ